MNERVCKVIDWYLGIAQSMILEFGVVHEEHGQYMKNVQTLIEFARTLVRAVLCEEWNDDADPRMFM